MTACLQPHALVEDLYHNPFMQDASPYHLLDEQGTILLINHAWMDWFGYGGDHVIGEPIQDYLTQASGSIWSRYFLMMLTTRQIIRIKLDLVCEDASIKTVNLTGFVTDHREGYACTHCLISADDTMELAFKHPFHEALLANTREGVLVTDAHKRIVYVNHAFTELMGYSEQELLGQTPAIFKSGHHDHDFYTSLWSEVARNGCWQGEIWDRQKDGRLMPDFLSITAVTDRLNQITHYVGIFSDVSRLKKSQQEEISYLMNHDSLTRLPNRKWMMGHLNQVVQKSEQLGLNMSLLMLDLDDFKFINDSYGHAIGDEFLAKFAARMLRLCEGTDSLSRLGGDEFAFILEDIAGPNDVARFAERVLESLIKPFDLSNGLSLHIGATLGATLYPYNATDAKVMLQQADTAVYLAKAQQKSHYAFFCQEMTQAIQMRMRMESALKFAVLNDQLRLYFQPKVDARNKRIFSAEALVRWEHPDHGLVSPDEFIPLAEQSNLIHAIGEWVMKQACLQGAEWQKCGKPEISLAVNVSVVQITRGDLVPMVMRVLDQTGFPAHLLEIEITESTLMLSIQNQIVEDLNQLRAMGVRIALDDFGTGYSSLAYLKRYPLDVIKIDKSFIQDLPNDQDSAQIVSAVIVMAKSLGLEVLAEGVESFEQIIYLQQNGCDLYQGFFCGKAVPAEEFSHICTHSQHSFVET